MTSDQSTPSEARNTGRLSSKRDASGKGPDYTYTHAGRLKTRKNTRLVTATNTYQAGFLVSTTYDDGGVTPDVSYAYDALGRFDTVSNGLAKSEFTYADDLGVKTETITYTLPGQASFKRRLDRKTRSLGRDRGWDLQKEDTNGDWVAEHSATYQYHATTGRLQSVSDGTDTFTYEYLSQSPGLLSTVEGPVHTATNVWEDHRNLLVSKTNRLGTVQTPGALVSRYDYEIPPASSGDPATGLGANAIGQRTDLATTGMAFDSALTNPAVAGPAYSWDYDALGQLTSADADSSHPSFDRGYRYDSIGNRESSVDSALTPPDPGNYTVSALNQYTSTPWDSVQTPAHDADGNLSAGPVPGVPGVWGPDGTRAATNLVWNADNRLVSITVGTVTVTYAYDFMGRRISRTKDGNTWHYIHDGWNMIALYYNGGLGRTYLWGLDLSGTLRGAGGVGGLLCADLVSAGAVTDRYYPLYDGNGNVCQYLDGTGDIDAVFQYDPFGRMLSVGGKTSQAAHSLRFRFSTKWRDYDTGLYDYGYRHYNPLTGRWISRDPIGERGGANLYGFVYNNPLYWIDILGKDPWPTDNRRPQRRERGRKVPIDQQSPYQRKGLRVIKIPKTLNSNGNNPAKGTGSGDFVIMVVHKMNGVLRTVLNNQMYKIALEACKAQKAVSGKSWGCCKIGWIEYSPRDFMTLYFPRGGRFIPCMSCVDVKMHDDNPELRLHTLVPKELRGGRLKFKDKNTYRQHMKDFYYQMCGSYPSDMTKEEWKSCQDRIEIRKKRGILSYEIDYQDM
jgi:RHS repeat-associated protein